jgi:hypothetical protein
MQNKRPKHASEMEFIDALRECLGLEPLSVFMDHRVGAKVGARCRGTKRPRKEPYEAHSRA